MNGFLTANAWIVPFLPLLGAIIAGAGGRWLKQQAHWPVVLGIGAACVVSLLLFMNTGEGLGRTIVYNWIDAGSLHVPVEMRVDGLTTLMLSMVTFVATLVAIFAVGYMAGDPGYARFFSVVGLFVFSMTGLVLSSNYVLTYAFWEGVGVCSYLLIGFWHAKPAAAAAAKKAFLVNRIGDFGFAVALFWIWTTLSGLDWNQPGLADLRNAMIERTGTFSYLSYDVVLSEAVRSQLPQATLIGIALLLFWGATAKSAQVPLYVWLPDAMEGPTPVSALIHAATMVTAGVYLIARSAPLAFSAPIVPLIVAIVGCVTALLAASIAVTQTDLKRVLAYSTVSQLGYMFMALGAGVGSVARLAVVAAMFHLFTHAFFKALLFLGSGSVMHAMGGVIDMRRFRGLRHRMPYTCWTFAIGGLALSGIPPLAGFWSKDEILTALKHASHAVHGAGGPEWGPAVYLTIYWVAVLTAFMTAFYTGRAFFLTFFGPEKLPSPDDPEAAEAEGSLPHEHAAMPVDAAAPETSQLAEYEAAMAGAVAGSHAAEHPERERERDPHRPAGNPPPTPGATDEPVPQHGGHGHAHGHGHGGHDDHFGHESPPVMWVPLVILAVCATLVGMIFGPTHWFEHHIIERTPAFEHDLAAASAHGPDWATILVGSLVGLAGVALSYVLYANPSPIPGRIAASLKPLYRASLDKFYVDEIYGWIVVGPTRLLAIVSKFFDTYIIDGLVRLTAFLPPFVGRNMLAPFQNGLIQYYAAVTALGLASLLLILLLMR